MARGVSISRPVTLTAKPGPALLEVRQLHVLNEREEFAVDGVDLMVRAGEIVGVAGVQGNGQTELVQAITGLKPVASGTLSFLGRDITRASARACHSMGMAHIPEDRRREGIIGELTIAENIALNTYYDRRFSSGLMLRWRDVETAAAQDVRDFDVRTPSIFAHAQDLSGGNQQKLVVARELARVRDSR